jgi:putative AlgH/UPF0301 family transcriptional regulator
MKLTTRLFSVLAVAGMLLGAAGGAARAQDLSQTVMLVATAGLDGTVFEQAVVIAAPLPNGNHVGFIINRPANVKLTTLFPDQETARNVVDGAYLGGPAMANVLFAVVRGEPTEPDEKMVPLLPGLYAVLDGSGVDRVIAETPNDARYFIGVTLWDPKQLEQQVRSGDWVVKAADASAVFRKTNGLWSELRATTTRSDANGTWL